MMADKMPPRKLKLRVQCQDGTITFVPWYDEVRVVGKTVQLVKFPEGGERPALPPDDPRHFNDGNIVQFIAKLDSDEDTSRLYSEIMKAIEYRREHFSVEEWAQANYVVLRQQDDAVHAAAR